MHRKNFKSVDTLLELIINKVAKYKVSINIHQLYFNIPVVSGNEILKYYYL